MKNFFEKKTVPFMTNLLIGAGIFILLLIPTSVAFWLLTVGSFIALSALFHIKTVAFVMPFIAIGIGLCLGIICSLWLAIKLTLNNKK